MSVNINYLIKHIPSLKLQFSSRNILIKLVTVVGDKKVDLYYSDLANISGSSVKTVQRAKAQLVEHGYIAVKQNNGIVGNKGRKAGTFTVNLDKIKSDIEHTLLYMPIH